ncbi:hypothetical protein MVEG_06038 [Podila verticillata NRRL 6337]|nr:MAG: legume-like lectin family-domain-containing protein [Podila humilis]KFH67303.1 hypothetical protein MVEG_06038 [Podila verticillata NRRL 6337]
MKTTFLLVPAAFLTTAMAWGRGRDAPASPPSPSDTVLPAKGRRYDYKQSLKKPFMYNNELPFWGQHGNTFVAQDFVRLAPSVPGLRGSVWRKTPNEHKEWEVEFSFKAHGQSPVGGRGFAFWYTQDRAVDGPVFGNQDKWKGLGVFMDTSDPANQRTNSLVYGLVNNGTEEFPADVASITNFARGCMRDYKNSPNPVHVRVSYIAKTLKISVDTHSKGRKMVGCFEHPDVDLPAGYHFGFSAASSLYGLPDDHDLYTFEVYEVNPASKTEKHLRPHEAEMIKKSGEIKVDEKDKEVFEEVQKIVEDQELKDREHSEGTVISASKLAATVGDTQFRIIESLNTIHNKLESLGAPAQPPESTTKSLEEINAKIQKMAASLHAMESVVQGLVNHIMNQGGVQTGPEITRVLKEELSNLNAKMEDMDSRQSLQHHLTQNRLVNSTSWFTYIIVLILVQAAAMAAYTWYKKRLEMSEKKFI